MLKLEIRRYKKSYDFKADPAKPDSFENNWKNNGIDIMTLFNDADELYQCGCQSVANYCFGSQLPGDTVPHGDTIAPGKFTLRCFVEPRTFHGEIHAIINTIDIDGQKIDRNAMQTTAGGYQNGRWLLHDRYSFTRGCDTNIAWSAGCIILSSADLEKLNSHLRISGVKPGDELSGEIIESVKQRRNT